MAIQMRAGVLPYGVHQVSIGGVRQLGPGLINPVRLHGADGRTYYSLNIHLPSEQTGIVEAILDENFNIVSEKAQIPGQDSGRPVELLYTEPDLEALTARVVADPFNIFFRRAGGVGHNAAVWPFANRHNGQVFGEPGEELVEVPYGGQIIQIPANWPPAGSGWGTEPSRAIHGFGYGLLNELIGISPLGSAEKGMCFLEGQVRLANQWFGTLVVKHKVILDQGILKRLLTVNNIGTSAAPFSGGEHPDFAIPEGQPRGGVRLNIPAESLVMLDNNSLLPDLSRNPFCAVGQSYLKHLFNARDEKGFFPLGDQFLDQCFIGLSPNPVARMMFPDVGWGVAVQPVAEATSGMINVLQVYAPVDNREIIFELQGNVPDPFNPLWDNFSDIRQARLWPTGSGLSIIRPGAQSTWGVQHWVEMMR